MKDKYPIPVLFDRIGTHFLKNIYTTAKGRIRLAVLQRDLMPLLCGKPLQILDIGGGAGQMAMWYASLGHHVTVIDVSQQLLAEGQSIAQALGLDAQMEFFVGDACRLMDVLQEKTYDGVCCHAVLEWVEDGAGLLQACAARIKPGGFFSLMYYNRAALRFAQHVFGNFDYLDRDLKPYRKTAKLTPNYPRDIAEIDGWVELLHLTCKQRSAIRCFYDYMKPHDRERHSIEALITRELALSVDSAYLSVSRYIHDIYIK